MTRIHSLLLAAVLLATVLLTASTAAAQTAVSTPRYQWTVSSCEKWNCAVAALTLAEGDPAVLVLPTKSGRLSVGDLKRVEAGSIVGPEDENFAIDTYTEVHSAIARYSGMDVVRVPMLVTTTDGGMLVVSLREPVVKRRGEAPAVS